MAQSEQGVDVLCRAVPFIWQAYVLRAWSSAAELVKRVVARGRPRLRFACAARTAAWVLSFVAASAFGQGATKADPDLQVGGFAVFGTNLTGAGVVTSGWGSAYMEGSLQVHSNLVVDGTLVNTNLVQMGRQSLAKHDQLLLTEGSTIQPVSSYIRVRGATTPVSLGDPQIAAGAPGQLLTLQGVSDSYKVALANGTGLRTMLGQPFHLGAFDTIQFIYDDSTLNWVEINRSQNRWSN